MYRNYYHFFIISMHRRRKKTFDACLNHFTNVILIETDTRDNAEYLKVNIHTHNGIMAKEAN